MGWMVRILMVALVACACAGGWSAGGVLAHDLKVLSSTAAPVEAHAAAGPSGPALTAKVQQTLGVVNAQRESRKDGDPRVVFLEKVTFERSAGGVVARGSVADLGAPRRLNVVIDAFDASRRYLASSSSGLDTSTGSTSFSVVLRDQDAFQSFSVRFLDAGMEEVVMRSADTPVRKIPPLLPDDPLHPADMLEVAERLVSLGYADKVQPVRDEIVAAALVARFRRDYGISGPSGVTIGDLVALRSVSDPAAHPADLLSY